MNLKWSEINWPTFLFFIFSPIGAIAGVVYVALYTGFHPATIALTVFMIFATGIGITGGYHRLFSHKSYEASKLVRWLYVFFGSAALEMSVIEWAYDHRNHHRYVDHEEDPYAITKGFWFAHILWLFRKRGTGNREEVDLKQVQDLWKDPVIRFQHKFYMPIALTTSFLFPALIASLWGDFTGGLLIAGLARTVWVHQATFCINSVCHYLGTQPYSDRHTARDSWFTALVTYGEGYHNYHHEFPVDYRNGIRRYQYDPTKWLIFFLSKLGLTWNLKRIPDEKILAAKMEMQEKRLAALSEKQTSAGFAESIAAIRETGERTLAHIQARFDELATNMKEMRKAKTSRSEMKELRKRLIRTYRLHEQKAMAMMRQISEPRALAA
ncbi:MAG: fatty acid desaturase [Leptospiraceae bacterium]|nr:fatty acid desaturase [Leptospiraceae bacterium]MCB1304676.1 fatty acid desaturase [Leptospiraceae bacterium]